MRLITALLISALSIEAQAFNSQSNGSDGALNLTTPGTILFDPRTFNPPLDSDGDNIYHFTTINIGQGVIVKLRDNVVNGPVFWLAQGAITIAGTVDLNGEPGYNDITTIAERTPSTAGSGGYAGGVGEWSPSPYQPGFGPGGGQIVPAPPGCFIRHEGGRNTSNAFLVPLTGGSGGAGGNRGGGAGGGAILLASSVSVSVTGSITANGGAVAVGGGRKAGGGAGGSIRILAPLITGNGSLTVAASGSAAECSSAGSAGFIRLEAFTFNTGLSGTRATPFDLFLPSGKSSARVVTIGGIPVPPSPTGSFVVPDVVLNSSAPVPFAIEARNIPVGTVIRLYILSENGPDLIINSSPLEGTDALSTTTATTALPPGFSRGFVRATWVQ